jgi:hypothetical protein
MNRKKLRKLQESFEKRGGMFGVSPDAPPEAMMALFDELVGCPDCRAAILEACNGDDRKNVDIDAVMRDLAMGGDH